MIRLGKFILLLSMVGVACSVLTIAADVPLVSHKIELKGDSSRPEMSTYALGEDVRLSFEVTGLQIKDKNLQLVIRIVDSMESSIDSFKIPITTESDTWKYSFHAPSSRKGFYRVYAQLSNGVMLPARGSRKAGYLTYCVVPDPAKRKLYPADKSRFGIQGGFSKSVNVLPYLGARWALGGFSWKGLEPDHAGEYAERCELATKEGKQKPGMLPIFDWAYVIKDGQRKPWTLYSVAALMPAPKWSTLSETAGCSTAALNPAGEKAWRQFCLDVAKVYTESYTNSVHYYQITWEPNYPWGYKGTDEQLVKIYEIAYAALHEVDPDAQVLGVTLSGGFTKNSLETHAALFKKGLGKYIDGISLHAYKKTPDNADMQIRMFKEMVKSSAGKDFPIYITEQGCPTYEDMNKEQGQAESILWNNLISLGEGIEFNMTFYITDYSTEPGYGFYYNLDPSRKFGTAVTSPKPVVPAYAAMTYLLDGYTSAGAIEWLGETIYGYAYELDKEVILALWNTEDEPCKVTLPVGVENVEMFDWMGNIITANIKEKILSVTLTKQPLYIRGVSSEVWGSSSHKPLTLATHRITASPDSKVNIPVTVKAPANKVLKAELRIESNSCAPFSTQTTSINLQAGAEQQYILPMHIPQDIPIGGYPLKITLQESNKLVAADGLMLSVKSPVQVQVIRPVMLKKGSWGLQADLRETIGASYTGNIDFKLKGVPESNFSTSFSVMSNNTQDVLLPLSGINIDPLKVYTVEVSISNETGRCYTFDYAINFFYAQSPPDSVIIDGDLAEWNSKPVHWLKGKSHLVRSEQYYDGSWDSSANFRIAQDAQYLYFTFKVDDDVFLQKWTQDNTWLGDSIQIGINLDPYLKEQETGNLLLDQATRARWSSITLALTEQGCEAYRGVTYNRETLPCGLLSKCEVKVAIKTQKDNKGLIYEIAIPWKTLGVGNKENRPDVIGLAFSLNDRDAPKPKQFDPSALGAFDGISPWNIQQFGKVVLEMSDK